MWVKSSITSLLVSKEVKQSFFFRCISLHLRDYVYLLQFLSLFDEHRYNGRYLSCARSRNIFCFKNRWSESFMSIELHSDKYLNWIIFGTKKFTDHCVLSSNISYYNLREAGPSPYLMMTLKTKSLKKDDRLLYFLNHGHYKTTTGINKLVFWRLHIWKIVFPPVLFVLTCWRRTRDACNKT